MLDKFKTVRKILPAPRKHWVGNGFNVYPVFAQLAFTELLSPWLMFDYASPKQFSPTSSRLGVGQHPHRGFETITIAFQGEIEHADSTGNRDVIKAGDVQWMTAGRGIIHEEFHGSKFAEAGGTLEMCQLWLNLCAALLKSNEALRISYPRRLTSNALLPLLCAGPRSTR